MFKELGSEFSVCSVYVAFCFPMLALWQGTLFVLLELQFFTFDPWYAKFKIPEATILNINNRKTFRKQFLKV